MSSILQEVKKIVDSLKPQECWDLWEYLAPRLKLPASPKPRSVTDLPSALEVLNEMRSSRDKGRPITTDADANWARLIELGREMNSQPGTGKSLTQILHESRE
jgi:hypothetical protein